MVLSKTLVSVKLETIHCANNCFAYKIHDMEQDYYTTGEAAKQLGVTVGRVRQMIVDGLLKTKRFGRAHMISQDALKTAEQRRTKPGPAPKMEVSGLSKKKDSKT